MMFCPRTGHGHDVLRRRHPACLVVCGTSFGRELLDVVSCEVTWRILRFTVSTTDDIGIVRHSK
jgi:hypothetical protein